MDNVARKPRRVYPYPWSLRGDCLEVAEELRSRIRERPDHDIDDELRFVASYPQERDEDRDA